MDQLLGESEARDFLVARTLAQDDEITYHKHMRDVQEGKTAAQTSKANKALRNEAEALKEAADANVAAASERERREVAETERSGLIAANVNMAIAIRNGSAGIQVSQFLFVFIYLFCNAFFLSEPNNRRLETESWIRIR